MKNKISKAVAVLALAAATVFAAPAVASAYTPVAPSAIVPGEPTPMPTPAGIFVPGEDVTFTLVGEGVTDASLGMIVAAAVSSTSETVAAEDDGSAVVTVTLPENASGSYSLAAVSESGASYAFPAIAAAADGTDGTDDGTTDDGGPAIADTGFDGEQLLGLWIGGGILVLAGASIAVATSVRRARQTA
jgi:hypothetical protein